MQVMLLERVRNLGHLGEKVNVKPGYARNYLIPYGKAVPATKENIAYFEQRRAELEKADQETLAQAQKRADALKDVIITIKRKTAEEGKLYGSVGLHDIIEFLAQSFSRAACRETVSARCGRRVVGTAGFFQGKYLGPPIAGTINNCI